MRYFIFCLVFLFGCFFECFSQEDSVIYYDVFGKLTTNKADGAFIRKASRKSNYWAVKDYYAENNQLKSSGIYLDKDFKVENGSFIWYFSNGRIQESGNFTNGKKDGDWYGFFDTGKPDYKGRYFDGKMHGIWEWYYETGGISAKEIYDLGQIITWNYWNEDSVQHQDTSIVNKTPAPKGGVKALFEFLEDNILYPEESRKKNVEGTVVVDFFVERDGRIGDVRVKKTVDPMLDAEAIRVIQLLPPFSVGINKNRKIRVGFTLPVRFKLTD